MSAAALRSTPETAMLRKFIGLAALTVAGAALLVPDATFARGGMGGGVGGFRGGLRPATGIHRAPFMVRTGPGALGGNAATFPPGRSTPPPPGPPPPPLHTPVRRPL